MKYKRENLERVISESTNLKDVLLKLGLRIAGGNFNTIKKYIELYNLDTSHFNSLELRIAGLKKLHTTKLIPLENILIENSTYNRTDLKKRLYSLGLKKRICELCGQSELWNGTKMSLILDHVNGVHNDNRIENLRIVCPNCNATLDTHCGKNIKNKKITQEEIEKQKKLIEKMKEEEQEKLKEEKRRKDLKIEETRGRNDMIMNHKINFVLDRITSKGDKVEKLKENKEKELKITETDSFIIKEIENSFENKKERSGDLDLEVHNILDQIINQ